MGKDKTNPPKTAPNPINNDNPSAKE